MLFRPFLFALAPLALACTLSELKHPAQDPIDAVQIPPDTAAATAPQEPQEAGDNKPLVEIMRVMSPQGREWVITSGPNKEQKHLGTCLYILPADGGMEWQPGIEAWHSPGRLIDGRNDETYYEAEVFAGEVLQDTIGVIWYERSLMPDGRWKENTVLLNFNKQDPDTLVMFGHGRKAVTQHLAFNGKCRVLAPFDQVVKP